MRARRASALIAALLLSVVSLARAAPAENTVPSYRQVAADFLAAPVPEFPRWAVFQGMQGIGIYVAHADPATGAVSRVDIRTSTGYRQLDDSVIATLLGWKLKPHTATTFSVPVLFLLDRDTEQSYSNAIRYAVRAPFPRAPFQARANTHEFLRGLYELDIDRASGAVVQVKIVSSSHSNLLDLTAQRTFSQWRFQPHSLARVVLPVDCFPLHHL